MEVRWLLGVVAAVALILHVGRVVRRILGTSGSGTAWIGKPRVVVGEKEWITGRRTEKVTQVDWATMTKMEMGERETRAGTRWPASRTRFAGKTSA